MSNDTFFLHHKSIVADILESPRTHITLICSDSDQDQLFGYVVAQKFGDSTVVHFVYTKYNYRKFGLMSEVCKALGYLNPTSTNFITHLPRNYHSYKSKYNLEFNPYLLEEI